MLAHVISRAYPLLGEVFAGQANRTVGYVSGEGAELGEAFAVLTRIHEAFTTVHDFESRCNIWYEEWTQTAQYVAGLAEISLAHGQSQSARQGFIRGAEYYRQGVFFKRASIKNLQWIEGYKQSYACFDRAMGVGNGWVGKPLNIPYRSSTTSSAELTGRLLIPTTKAVGNICVILPGGYDSTISEMYSSTAVGALRRGYSAYLFDGPGQGLALLNGHFMQHDFEVVLKCVLDHLDEHFGVNKHRYVLVGRSFGGYLVPRGLTTNSDRIAAAVVDPGQLELVTPEKIAQFLENQAQKKVKPAEASNEAAESAFFWQSRCTVHGKQSQRELFDVLREYSSRGKLGNVKCPVLVFDNPVDTRSNRGTPLYEELVTPIKKLYTFDPRDGATDHCESGASASFERVVFDWLGETLSV